MGFEDSMRELAKVHPHMSISDALKIVDDVTAMPTHRWTDPRLLPRMQDSIQLRAEWVFNNEPIMQLMRDNKKINAIKETRAETYLGLKEAKDACELAWEWELAGKVPESLKAQIEAEAQEAIASIEQTMKEQGNG